MRGTNLLTAPNIRVPSSACQAPLPRGRFILAGPPPPLHQFRQGQRSSYACKKMHSHSFSSEKWNFLQSIQVYRIIMTWLSVSPAIGGKSVTLPFPSGDWGRPIPLPLDGLTGGAKYSFPLC